MQLIQGPLVAPRASKVEQRAFQSCVAFAFGAARPKRLLKETLSIVADPSPCA